MDSILVFRRRITEVEVQETRDQHQQNEEGAEQNWNLVVLLEKETRKGNGNIVAARAVGVTVLLKVFIRGLIGQDLSKNEGVS